MGSTHSKCDHAGETGTGSTGNTGRQKGRRGSHWGQAVQEWVGPKDRHAHKRTVDAVVAAQLLQSHPKACDKQRGGGG
jgi:hypothetical protein